MEQMFMISKNGIMQPCVEHPELPKGTIVYSYGAGMWNEKWATTGNEEELVKLSPNCSESYFSSPFHTLDKYCKWFAKIIVKSSFSQSGQVLQTYFREIWDRLLL